MNELTAEQNDFFLQQLQKRLVYLAAVDKDEESYTDSLPQLKQLIEKIYTAQNGIVSVSAIAQAIDIQMLLNHFPNIISTADESRPAPITTPIIAFTDFVSFRREWQQLNDTAEYLRNHIQQAEIILPTDNLSIIQWELANGFALSDEQKLAAISAAVLPFCIITGGAGTGKTTTLAKALELCLLDNPACHIAITAPTGKAAHRLNESLANQLDSVNLSVREKLQQLHATTLHRLLGISEHSGRPFHNAKNPLACEVLVVDEASMVSGDLFAHLQNAVLPSTRIILLGDANQLPAINSTAFFTEISQLPIGYSQDFCDKVNPYLENKQTMTASQLPNAICRLTVSRRFGEKSLIEQTADAILAENTNEIIALLANNFVDLSVLGSEFIKKITKTYPTEKTELLNTLEKRIILCANRQGIFGTNYINRYLDVTFRKILGNPALGKINSEWYTGRRILIEQNDYQLGINNGDIGCCQWADDSWQIVFDDGRQLPVSHLLAEKYSLAFAITIHKSQGSEYPHVDIVLDSFDTNNPNQLVNKPLLYTAVTRAKESLTLYTDKPLLEYALRNTDSLLSPLSVML